jgi:hypothetical protein
MLSLIQGTKLHEEFLTEDTKVERRYFALFAEARPIYTAVANAVNVLAAAPMGQRKSIINKLKGDPKFNGDPKFKKESMAVYVNFGFQEISNTPTSGGQIRRQTWTPFERKVFWWAFELLWVWSYLDECSVAIAKAAAISDPMTVVTEAGAILDTLDIIKGSYGGSKRFATIPKHIVHRQMHSDLVTVSDVVIALRGLSTPADALKAYTHLRSFRDATRLAQIPGNVQSALKTTAMTQQSEMYIARDIAHAEQQREWVRKTAKDAADKEARIVAMYKQGADERKAELAADAKLKREGDAAYCELGLLEYCRPNPDGEKVVTTWGRVSPSDGWPRPTE